MKYITTLLLFFILQNSYAQVTFLVEKLPENTPENATIYISGDFEGWTGGQEPYKLSKNKNTYFITLPKQSTTIHFKFTQGSWNSVETDLEGNDLNNRTYTYTSKTDTVKAEILNWANTTIKKSTATENVSVLSEKFYIPQLDRNRKIWIYLPPGYDESDKHYPVMYMHDGQNLFDSSLSFSGEWEVDETLNKLYQEKGMAMIVIGIDNGGNKRLDEYSPWKNEKYGGGEGEAYVDFIVNDLKPYVDKNYKTIANKNQTAIMGSSMGGLISYYAALKAPDVFGKIGVFSPAFWFSNESFTYAKTNGNIKDTKMYLLAGDKEGEKVAIDEINQTVKGINDMVKILKQEGFTPDNITTKVVPDGLHNEKMWRENFEEAVLWLFDQ